MVLLVGIDGLRVHLGLDTDDLPLLGLSGVVVRLGEFTLSGFLEEVRRVWKKCDGEMGKGRRDESLTAMEGRVLVKFWDSHDVSRLTFPTTACLMASMMCLCVMGGVVGWGEMG